MQSKLLTCLLDLLFPPKCVFCRKLLPEGGRGICDKCKKTLPYTQGKNAVVSGEFFRLCAVPLYYESDVRESFHRYKFQSMESYAQTYAELMANCIAANLKQPFDFITYAPVSRKRKRQRGYDQSELLARELGKLLGLPTITTLKKNRDNKKQSTMTDKARRKANVLGVYDAVNFDTFQGCKILLIDDIITTGSTMSECSRTLLTAGAAGVTGAAFARKRNM